MIHISWAELGSMSFIYILSVCVCVGTGPYLTSEAIIKSTKVEGV